MKNLGSRKRIILLSNLKEGENGKIIQIRGTPDIQRHLNGVGLAIGRRVSIREGVILTRGPFSALNEDDEPVRIERDLTNNIKVQIL